MKQCYYMVEIIESSDKGGTVETSEEGSLTVELSCVSERGSTEQW